MSEGPVAPDEWEKRSRIAKRLGAEDQLNAHREVAVLPVADVVEADIVHDLGAVAFLNTHGDHLHELIDGLLNGVVRRLNQTATTPAPTNRKLELAHHYSLGWVPDRVLDCWQPTH